MPLLERRGANLRDSALRASASARAAACARRSSSLEELGPNAVIYKGQREHARTAIQCLSSNPQHVQIFTHTGWRQIGEQWVYFHGGGALGRDGCLGNVQVDLPDELVGYELKIPATSEKLIAAVKASLRVLEVAPDHISYPVLAAVYRAALIGFPEL
jgi:hypothetical protein